MNARQLVVAPGLPALGRRQVAVMNARAARWIARAVAVTFGSALGWALGWHGLVIAITAAALIGATFLSAPQRHLDPEGGPNDQAHARVRVDRVTGRGGAGGVDPASPIHNQPRWDRWE